MCSLYGMKEVEENYSTYRSHASACLPASALGPWRHWWSAWACCSPQSGRLWTGGHQSPGLRSVQTDTNQSIINKSAGSDLVVDIIWNKFTVSPVFSWVVCSILAKKMLNKQCVEFWAGIFDLWLQNVFDSFSSSWLFIVYYDLTTLTASQAPKQHLLIILSLIMSYFQEKRSQHADSVYSFHSYFLVLNTKLVLIGCIIHSPSIYLHVLTY